MNEKELREAYEIVFADLISNCGGLPVGRYDAKNGNEVFMYGIGTIMELIASKIKKEDFFNEMFYQNMEESEKEYGNK